MDNYKENKEIALFVVNLVSKMYHLGDGVLVEFEPASRFPNAEVTAMVTRDYRIIFNKDRMKVAPDYELMITSFHEMRHIYQYCCIDFGYKLIYKKYFNEPKARVEKWKNELANYYVSEDEDDPKYLKQDIEIDAVAFAKYMMKALYQADVAVPGIIKVDVEERMAELNKKMKLLK